VVFSLFENRRHDRRVVYVKSTEGGAYNG